MKRYPYILKSISEYHAGKDANSIQDNKFKSKDWDKWCNLIQETKDEKGLR